MLRTLTGLFVVAHGLVTVAVWAPKYPAVTEGVQPPNPAHSWILGDARMVSLVFGIAVGLAIATTGIAFLTEQTWWPLAGVVSGAASLLLFAVFFTPWWVAGIAISIALIIAALRAGIPA